MTEALRFPPRHPTPPACDHAERPEGKPLCAACWDEFRPRFEQWRKELRSLPKCARPLCLHRHDLHGPNGCWVNGCACLSLALALNDGRDERLDVPNDGRE